MKKPSSSASKRVPVAIVWSASRRENAPSTTRTNATTPRYWSYDESNTSARGGASGSPAGGGTRSTIASSTSPTFAPVFAEIRTTRAGSSPSRSATSTAAPSGSACGRSILFTTGTISSPFSIARYAFASVCASIPCAASTTSSAPSHAWSERETSYVKSTCPGVSIRFSSWPFHATRTACALIVIPRSRSSSIESSSCSRMSRAATVSVTSRMRSASVDLPWSMWAMIEKLRILLWSMGPRGDGSRGAQRRYDAASSPTSATRLPSAMFTSTTCRPQAGPCDCRMRGPRWRRRLGCPGDLEPARSALGPAAGRELAGIGRPTASSPPPWGRSARCSWSAKYGSRLAAPPPGAAGFTHRICRPAAGRRGRKRVQPGPDPAELAVRRRRSRRSSSRRRRSRSAGASRHGGMCAKSPPAARPLGTVTFPPEQDGRDEPAPHDRPRVDLPLQERDQHRGALRVADEDDSAPVVVVREMIAERGEHTRVGASARRRR